MKTLLPRTIDWTDKPHLDPLTGVTCLYFTAEQVRTYKLVIFDTPEGPKDLILDDYFNPYEHSIEEAVVYSTSHAQKRLVPGQSIIVDYEIFASGRNAEMNTHASSRLMYYDDDIYIYYAYDDMHPYNSSEILATIDDEGHLTPFNDLIFVYPKGKEPDDYKKVGSLFVQPETPGYERATVAYSKLDGINTGDTVFYETGFNTKVKYRGIEMEYIRYSYLIGMATNETVSKIRLF